MTDKGPGRPRATSRDEIRAIATALFTRQGYGGTSLEQIAQAAGISRTTLFSYFPAKRDLIWQELDQRVAEMEQAIGSAGDRTVVDVIVDLVAGLASFRAAERDVLAARWRIVQEDDELRAYGGLQTAELTRRITAEAQRRAPACDPRLVDHVTLALTAVMARCTEEWSRGSGPGQDLEAYTTEQVRPIAAALRPLLP